MKKRIILFGIMLISLFIGIDKVDAATLNLKPSVSKSNLVIGNTVTVTVTLSSSEALGSWEYSLNYDSSKLDLVSSDVPLSYKGVVTSTNQKSVSYKYTFKAKASGTATFSFSKAAAYAYDESQMNINKSTSSVKIISKAELEASYSKNNYLSSLGVNGYSLDPEFNKDTLEYRVTLPAETYEAEITGSKEDNKASISGLGKKELTDGENRFEILVTAENGNERKYVVIITVSELSPVIVKINNKEYNVVRKKETLTTPDGYTDTTVTINEEEVPAFYSEVTKFTLVALKDAEGKVAYYIKDNDKYTEYKTFPFDKVDLYLEDFPSNIEIPKEYIKVKIKINGEEVEAYKLSKTSKYALIYGMNISLGTKDLYMYDSVQNTIQRYNNEEALLLGEKLNQFLYIIFILGIVSIILLIVLIITFITKSKRYIDKHKKISTKDISLNI